MFHFGGLFFYQRFAFLNNSTLRPRAQQSACSLAQMFNMSEDLRLKMHEMNKLVSDFNSHSLTLTFFFFL